MKQISKKIAILCNLDSFANSIRPLEIKKYLESKGHNVVLINNTNIYKEPNNKKTSLTLIATIQKLISKLNLSLVNFVDQKVNGWPYYFYLILKLKIRSLMVTRILQREKYNVVICENNFQAYVTLSNLNCITILDIDSPYTDELYYTGKISDKQRKMLNKIFNRVYSRANYLNFQWYKYTEYVRENIYDGKNIVEINFGCTLKELSKKAEFNSKPRIICLGYLGGKWVNLPLLSSLSKIYQIDVFGGPPPDKKWGLNYKGYAPTTDVLKDYQFGLITISKDKLRRSSFSSKHLEYLSYGLPVLTPEWRQDSLLKDVSIYFNEDIFLNLIKKYSSQKKWQQMSDACYKQAKEWNWEKVLEPLGDIISNIEVK